MQRALAFERAMHAAAGGRVITASWGQAFLDGSLPLCHERNALWAIDDAGGADAATLDAAAERLLGDAGLAHRRIVLEEAAHRRLHDELPARGYGASVHAYLAHSGPPPAAADGVAVVEVAPEPVLVANDRYLLTDPDTAYGRHDATRAQLLEHHRTYGPAGAQERRFAVLGDDGGVAAWARLWVRGDEAQVEDVVCLAEYRGRGYGRAVVAAATRAALAADPTLLFIVADDADWPKELYGRLGYGRVGHIGVFLALVPGAAGRLAGDQVRRSAGRGSSRRPPA